MHVVEIFLILNQDTQADFTPLAISVQCFMEDMRQFCVDILQVFILLTKKENSSMLFAGQPQCTNFLSLELLKPGNEIIIAISPWTDTAGPWTIPSLERMKRTSFWYNQYSAFLDFCGRKGIILITEITYREFKAAHSNRSGYCQKRR